MPQALLFDQNFIPSKILSGIDDINQIKSHNLGWVHLRSSDDLRLILPDIIDKSRGFTEDLLEEQRPRVAVYQTLEENDATFSVIVLTIPTNRIFEVDDFQLQVSFIIVNNKIYSIGSKEIGIIPEIMMKIQARRNEYTLSSLFLFIASELIEMGIDVLNAIEEFNDHTEGKQLKSNLERGWLASLLTLKSRLFDANKSLRADLEHIREIMVGELPEINSLELGEHLEDRLLYSIDYVDTLREELTNIINMNLAISNQLLQRQFYWLTIIGALLIIPTVVSGIFGMNVLLPGLTFTHIMELILGLTIVFALVVGFFVPRPTFS